jgi:hypothetical protein
VDIGGLRGALVDCGKQLATGCEDQRDRYRKPKGHHARDGSTTVLSTAQGHIYTIRQPNQQYIRPALGVTALIRINKPGKLSWTVHTFGAQRTV